MSPVSRGRKPKRSGARGKRSTPRRAASESTFRPPKHPLAQLSEMLGTHERPSWFDASIERVLDDSQHLTTADGPRDLEQRTSELVGAELRRAIDEEDGGLRFEWWLAELVAATEERVRRCADDGLWQGPFWLLHGLAATISRPWLSRAVLNGARKRLPRVADDIPRWLGDTPRISATGEVTVLHDAYGTRFGLIAEYSRRRADRSVFLFDIEASGFVELVDAGVFDDATGAAEAWRAAVGDAAEHAVAEPVRDVAELGRLVHLNTGDEFMIKGDEPQRVLDNWFRARRRIGDLADTLHRRGSPLPPAGSLYHDLDVSVLAEPFTAWYQATHGAAPDPEAVEALADEWMGGALPETWFCASPRRIEFVGHLIGDWVPDQVTAEVQRLLPEWVRWLSERAGLPERLRARLAAAAGRAGSGAADAPAEINPYQYGATRGAT